MHSSLRPVDDAATSRRDRSTRFSRVGALLLAVAGLTSIGCFEEADTVPPAACDAVAVSDLRVDPDAPVTGSNFDLAWTLSAECEEFEGFANAAQPSIVRIQITGGGLSGPAERIQPFPYDDIDACVGEGNLHDGVAASLVAEDLAELEPGEYTATVSIEGDLCDSAGASAATGFEMLPVGSCPGTATEMLDMQVSDLQYDPGSQTIRWTLTYAAELEGGDAVGPEVIPVVQITLMNSASGTVLASTELSDAEMLPLDSIDQEILLVDVGLPMPPQPGSTAEVRVALSAEADVLQCGGTGLEANDEAVIVVTFT